MQDLSLSATLLMPGAFSLRQIALFIKSNSDRSQAKF